MRDNEDRDEDSADSNEGPEDSEGLIKKGNTEVSHKRKKAIKNSGE